MSTDYFLVCFDCKEKMKEAFASGSIGYGFKVWDFENVKKWLGHKVSVGYHEGHDLRIVSEHYEFPGEDDSEEDI